MSPAKLRLKEAGDWRSARGLCFWKITRRPVACFGNIQLMWFIFSQIASNILQKTSAHT